MPLEERSSFTKDLSGTSYFQVGVERSPRFSLVVSNNMFYASQASPWEASGSSLEFSSFWLLERYQPHCSTHLCLPPRPYCELCPSHTALFLHEQGTVVPAQMREGRVTQRSFRCTLVKSPKGPYAEDLVPSPQHYHKVGKTSGGSAVGGR